MTVKFQIGSSVGFGKKSTSSLFPNLSSQGIEQEKMSVLNGRFLTALKTDFYYGTKDDGIHFDQKSEEKF